jgi:hypothetical protein
MSLRAKVASIAILAGMAVAGMAPAAAAEPDPLQAAVERVEWVVWDRVNAQVFDRADRAVGTAATTVRQVGIEGLRPHQLMRSVERLGDTLGLTIRF